jgi:hypothetical protein
MKVRVVDFEGSSDELTEAQHIFGKPEGSKPSDGKSSGYSNGDRVIGFWDTDDAWYEGVVDDVRDGENHVKEHHVAFDDGDERWLTADDLRPGRPRKEPQKQLKAQVVEKALTRLPLSADQRKVVEVVSEAKQPGISSQELADKVGLSRAQLAGVFGALGRRFAHTEGWPDGASLYDVEWDGEMGQYRYSGRPILREVLASGKL